MLALKNLEAKLLGVKFEGNGSNDKRGRADK